jgi:hypothetical protein
MIEKAVAGVVLAAGVAVTAGLGVARADVSVGNLRVSDAPTGARSKETFPPGTRDVYVLFDYGDASETAIALDVTAYGGIVVHQSVARYSGTGTATARIDGVTVMQNVLAELDAAIGSARGSAKSASEQQYGVAEYLSGVEAGVVRMGNAVTVLDRIDSPVADPKALAQLRDAQEQVTDLVRRAQRASAIEQKHALAARMLPVLDEAGATARDLREDAEAVSSAPLPVSGSTWDYVVRATLAGSPAASIEFGVDGGRLALPTLSKRARLLR